MNSLMTRVISAVVALVILIGTIYFFGVQGGLVVGVLLAFIGVFEYGRLVFRPLGVSTQFEHLFLGFGAFTLTLLVWRIDYAVALLASVVTLYFSCVMWLSRNRVSNATIQSLLAMSGTGFIYSVLFPALVLRLLLLEDGLQWFSATLLVVFMGDTMAYFGGRTFGKRKLMPEVSPKKTIAGSVSGLAGSALAGTLFLAYYFPSYPIWHFIVLGLGAGLVAQTGDLFASLFKRVAGAKDSGRIMPGHGGVLDRLDGIYFAGPLFYTYAVFAQTFMV